MRSNMTTNAPHHLYKNLKFSELYKFSDVRNSPLPLHINYRVREPHVSHMGINVCAHCPLHLPKKVTEKPSVNHIGSSTSHQWIASQYIMKHLLLIHNFTFLSNQIVRSIISLYLSETCSSLCVGWIDWTSVVVVTLMVTWVTSSTSSLSINWVSMATPGTRGRYYSRTTDLMTELTVAMATTTARWCCYWRRRRGRRWKSPRARGRRWRGWVRLL